MVAEILAELDAERLADNERARIIVDVDQWERERLAELDTDDSERGTKIAAIRGEAAHVRIATRKSPR